MKKSQAQYFQSFSTVPIAQGGPDYVLSSQTKKLMAATKFSDYLGLKLIKKQKKN